MSERSMLPPQVPPAVGRAQQVLAGIISFVLLVFTLTALIAVKAGLRSAFHGEPLSQSMPALLFGTIFSSVVIGFVAFLAHEMLRRRRENLLRAANPDRPWLWRKEWNGGIVQESPKQGKTFLLVLAIVWNAISLAILAVLIHPATTRPQPLLLLFPAAGVALIAVLVYFRLRARKYGRSRVRLQSFPIIPGEAFRAELQTRIAGEPREGFSFRLACVHRSSGSGRNASTIITVMWSDEQTVDAAATSRSPRGTVVPFTFTIPAAAQQSDERFPYRSIQWRLDVSARLPGIDYKASFTLPIFDPARLAPFEPVLARLRRAHDEMRFNAP